MSGKKQTKKPELDVLEQMNRDEQRKKIFFIAGAVVVVLLLVVAGSVFALKSKNSDAELASADRRTVEVDSSRGTKKDTENKKDSASAVKEEVTDSPDDATEQPESTSMEEVAKAGPPLEVSEAFMSYAREGDPARYTRELSNIFAATKLAASFSTYPTHRNDTLPGIREAISDSGQCIARLLNPYFGGWSAYQYPESNAREKLDMGLFSDMFTPEYLEAHKDAKDFSFLPIYADWDSDNYGMNNLVDTGVRWMGRPSNLQSEPILSDSGEVLTTMDVEFVSWTEDGKKVKKEGVLQLVFVPNRDPDGLAMLIDDAKLTV